MSELWCVLQSCLPASFLFMRLWIRVHARVLFCQPNEISGQEPCSVCNFLVICLVLDSICPDGSSQGSYTLQSFVVIKRLWRTPLWTALYYKQVLLTYWRWASTYVRLCISGNFLGFGTCSADTTVPITSGMWCDWCNVWAALRNFDLSGLADGWTLPWWHIRPEVDGIWWCHVHCGDTQCLAFSAGWLGHIAFQQTLQLGLQHYLPQNLFRYSSDHCWYCAVLYCQQKSVLNSWLGAVCWDDIARWSFVWMFLPKVMQTSGWGSCMQPKNPSQDHRKPAILFWNLRESIVNNRFLSVASSVSHHNQDTAALGFSRKQMCAASSFEVFGDLIHKAIPTADLRISSVDATLQWSCCVNSALVVSKCQE